MGPCYGTYNGAIGAALVVIGSLGIAGALSAYSFGWTTFALSIISPITVALPIIALLSAYGIIPMVAAGGVTVALGGLLFLISPSTCSAG